MLTRPQLAGKVFRGRDAVAAGLLTPDNLRSRTWRRVFQGIYADAALVVTHDIRCAAAITVLAPSGATVAGRSAATLYGARLGSPTDPGELLLPTSGVGCRHAGVQVHRGVLAATDRRRCSGVPVTSPVRTCWDLARWLDVVEAVVWIDRMLALRRVTAADLATYLEQQRDARTAARAFGRTSSLVDCRAESPQESRLRTRLTLAGLRPPAVQHDVYDDAGRFRGRVDLAWPSQRVAVEYDGVWHVGSTGQIHADRRRLNALASLGWTVLFVTSPRLRDDFDGVVAEIRMALRRSRR